MDLGLLDLGLGLGLDLALDLGLGVDLGSLDLGLGLGLGDEHRRWSRMIEGVLERLVVGGRSRGAGRGR